MFTVLDRGAPHRIRGTSLGGVPRELKGHLNRVIYHLDMYTKITHGAQVRLMVGAMVAVLHGAVLERHI